MIGATFMLTNPHPFETKDEDKNPLLSFQVMEINPNNKSEDISVRF